VSRFYHEKIGIH